MAPLPVRPMAGGRILGAAAAGLAADLRPTKERAGIEGVHGTDGGGDPGDPRPGAPEYPRR